MVKSQIPNPKSQTISKFQFPKYKPVVCNLWFVICGLFVICNLVSGVHPLFAKEITILYTGETHAMLYPCNCPKEQDGGLARRATLIKQLKKNNPATLVLDSGGFFASGLMDEYTQNTQLDKERTLINLKAVELMKYDALAIGDDEFNFGREFLEENMAKTNLAFISCNISDTARKPGLFRPYIIKENAGTKIGIIAVSPLSAREKAGGFKFIEPQAAVKQGVSELKQNKVNIIVLLSHLGESEDLKLIQEVQDIDILIIGHSRTKEEPSTKIGQTLILRPAWQGRRLGKLSLTLKDNQIADYKVEEVRLDDKISSDPDILAILPRCFSDNNCRQEGLIGTCLNPATLKSQCEFSRASKVSLLIITPKSCNVCDTEKVVERLKILFPGLVPSYLYYPQADANNLIADFGIKTLPVYLLGKEARQERNFDNLSANLEAKGDFYLLKPHFSGIAYFLERKRIKGRLDLFISLSDKNTPELLDAIKDFSPQVHFLAIEQADTFQAAGAAPEIEECLRSVCVQKYYPGVFFSYIGCRAKNIGSSWWEDCLGNLDAAKIKSCARTQEGRDLLRENVALNKELEIISGPTYLLDNQEIFSSQGAPKKEELGKIINGK